MQKILTLCTAAWRRLYHFAQHNTLLLSIAAVLVFLYIMIPTIVFNHATASLRYNAMDNGWEQRVPEKGVAIVLGAGVYPDGTPTPYLKWRIQTAVDLYNAGKVQKLLMSGDNGAAHYNEPEVMGRYAEDLGVPEEDIVLDFAGFNTYDTCYRARYIFDLREAVVVSQGYHVPRAVATCNELGIETVGVAAKHTGRDFTVPYLAREVLSTNKAVLQIITKPQATLMGAPEPIYIPE